MIDARLAALLICAALAVTMWATLEMVASAGGRITPVIYRMAWASTALICMVAMLYAAGAL